MAETKGFEPLVALTTQPFQDCTLSRSDKSPMPTYNTKVLKTCQMILTASNSKSIHLSLTDNVIQNNINQMIKDLNNYSKSFNEK